MKPRTEPVVICYSGSGLGIRAWGRSLVAWVSRSLAMIMLVLTALSLLFAETSYARVDEVPTEIKRKLFERYDQKNLTIIPDNVLVALLLEGPGFNGRGRDRLEYSVNYDHIDSHTSKDRWPKRYKSRNLLDEYTTEQVEAGAKFTDSLTSGEMVQVRLFYVSLDKNALTVDFYLVPLAGKRNASSQNSYGNSPGVAYKVDWGCRFRFYFGTKTPETSVEQYFDYINGQIGGYLLPTDTYLSIERRLRKPTNDATLPGKYLPENKSSQALELRPDKSYVMTYGGKEYNGKYELSGTNDLVFTAKEGQSKSRVFGDVIFGGGDLD